MPVIIKGSKAQVVEASMKRLILWHHITPSMTCYHLVWLFVEKLNLELGLQSINAMFSCIDSGTYDKSKQQHNSDEMSSVYLMINHSKAILSEAGGFFPDV